MTRDSVVVEFVAGINALPEALKWSSHRRVGDFALVRRGVLLPQFLVPFLVPVGGCQ